MNISSGRIIIVVAAIIAVAFLVGFVLVEFVKIGK
jgi:hypothetical protein